MDHITYDRADNNFKLWGTWYYTSIILLLIITITIIISSSSSIQAFTLVVLFCKVSQTIISLMHPSRCHLCNSCLM